MDSMIQAAKEHLAEFERSPNSHQGKAALINGLMQLVELRELASSQEIKPRAKH